MGYLTKEIKSSVVFTVLGIIAGYLAFVINNTALAVLAGIVLLAIVVVVVKKAMSIEEDKKWWIGNVVVIYLFLWFIVWTLLFNLVVL